MAKPNLNTEAMDKIVSLCKRKGFVYQSSEIYGGLNSCWDYGPLGAELKRNLKSFWWEAMTNRRDDIEGLDASILMHPKVWHTSGHVKEFTDPLIDCKRCKRRFRADKIEEGSKKCPECGGELTNARQFNLMFKTFMGPVEDEASVVYLRPETAQGIYVNFLNVKNSSRQKSLSALPRLGKPSVTKSRPAILFSAPASLNRWKCSFLCTLQKTKNGLSTGAKNVGTGIWPWE